MSFADDEGSHVDILIDGVPWQVKSLQDTAEGKPGLQIPKLHTTDRRGVGIPYHENSFHKLIGIYRRDSFAYIYIIPMAKLREKGKVSTLDAEGKVKQKGVTCLTVHMSAADLAGLPGGPICQALRWVRGMRGLPPKNKWTEVFYDGWVDIQGMLYA